MLGRYQLIRTKSLPYLQDVFLLAIRVHWGWGFFQAGLGKFTHFDRSVNYFESLGLPLPYLQVVLAGGVEFFGGLLLILGLGTSWVSVPLLFTMAMAFFLAHYEAVRALLSYPNIKPFLRAEPFLFMFSTLIVFLFGPGGISFDALRSKYSGSGNRRHH